MRDIYSLDIRRYYPGSSKERNGKGLPAVDRWKPSFISTSSLSSGDSRWANFGENYSPMDIGGLELFVAGGALTR
jgi:hypothetical protein